jgi:hypothetical protein
MKNIKSILKSIDIFGEPIQLNIKHKLRSNTSLGGILTILTILLLSAVTLATGLDLFYKENPEVNNEDQLFLQRPKFYLDKYTMPISFAFQDVSQRAYDIPKYFKFEILGLKVYNANGTTEVTNYDYENCTFAHFPNSRRTI